MGTLKGKHSACFSGLLLLGLTTFCGLAAEPASSASLRGSRSSLYRQNTQARRHDFTYILNRTQLQRFVAKGYLIPVRSGSNFDLHGVSFPYTRPAVKVFIDRLSRQYRAACGEKLVVTSLTRPRRYQPPNASPDSVHPTGMALDLRRPSRGTCRNWLERVLLSLEDRGVLEANRERWPPHYHVAVFPDPYLRYVERLKKSSPIAKYRVARGDTLWKIARKHSTTVQAVIRTNGLRSNRIYPGQVLQLPTAE